MRPAPASAAAAGDTAKMLIGLASGTAELRSRLEAGFLVIAQEADTDSLSTRHLGSGGPKRAGWAKSLVEENRKWL